MKPLRSSILLILILTTSLFAQSEPRPQSNAADVVVTDLRIEAKNVNQVLAEIAYRYSIVKQKRAYTWEATETGIRVFPRSEFRDPLLQALLAQRISRFVLPKRTAKLTFRQNLSGRPELKTLLASYTVSSSIEAFSPDDIAPFGNDFWLDVENATVRSILDQIITDSPTKYWFINRDGENRQYLVINF